MNEVKLIGNLGSDPEIRYTPQGTAVAKLSIATAESWKDKNGDKVERTEWHRVILWDNLAKIAGEFLKKGRQVYVSGKLQTRKWDDNGTTRYATEIVGREVLFLGAPAGSSSPKSEGNEQSKRSADSLGITDSDVPF